MKIAFLCRGFGLVNRGAEIYVRELSSRLEKAGHQVKVLPDAASLSTWRPGIVISTNGRLDVLAARAWCLIHGARLIISGQSGLGLDDRVNLYTFPHAFIGLTDFQCRWAARVNPGVKVVKISNGVDLSRFRQGVNPIPLDLSRPVILHAGALEPDFKRQDLLIAAVAGMDRGSLLLVGTGQGPGRKKIEEQGSRLLPGRFRIMSFSHDEMPGVYAAADLFSFPTVPWESFGLVLLEAMASGLPVVASDDPIRREIVSRAGLFVDPARVSDYTRALQQALQHDWQNLPRTQAEKYGWDGIAADYDRLFHQLIPDAA